MFEVTQGFDNDRGAAPFAGVSGFQSHDASGLVDQPLDLPLVFHNPLLLSLDVINNNGDNADQ